MNTQSPLFKTIAHLLIAVMWAQPLHSIAANLSVDHQGGGNTHITSANNGVPVVNIATPNGKGLSHNKFTDYNVGQQGLILNNSVDKLTSTQLGGIIFGNSQLKGKAANTILNEVTGGQRSQLKGYTEVAGKQAHVIVANPHGITCDGCGFINTPHATLTTGQPMIFQGQLQGYDVNGGDIEIVGVGLNASNLSRFDLITRSAKINAELHANELNIITGRNQVEAGTLQTTAKTDTTNGQPLLAIDSSALGGMYAGAIRLVGTEAGVGVKLAGDMAASAGDIRIDANGKLVIARAAAGQNLQLIAESIELEKDAYAGKKAQITAQTLRVQDSLAAGELIEIEATRFENTGVTEAGIRTDGTAQSTGQMVVRAGQVVNSGELASHGALEMAAHSLDNRQGHISSTAMGSIYADDVNNHQGHIVSQGNLNIAAQELDNGDGVLLAERKFTVQANAVTNAEDGLLVAGTDADILLSGGLNNAGRIQAGQDLSVHSGSGALVNSGSLGAGADVQLTAAQIRNDEGVMLSGGDLQLTGEEIINRRGDMLSLGSVLITAQEQDGIGGRFSNLSGTIESVGDLQIEAAQIENAREDFATRTYKYSARLVHVGCTDCSGDKENSLFRLDEIDRTEVTRNSPQAMLLSGGDMRLQGRQVDNRYSLMAAAGNLHIDTQRLNNQGAQTGDVSQSRVLVSHRVRSTSGQVSAANTFSARNWHGSSSYNPGNIAGELNSFINSHIYGEYSRAEPALSNVEYHHATLQAAGSIHIDAEEQLNNSLIRPSFIYVSDGRRDDGDIATLVPLNPQQMTDLTQQPVGIPEFVLPQGSNGLFNISRNPGHNYLIETNPLLANMRQFLSSDYLLGELGLSPENMQKRLGDGLYEQKLMREAWVARTGQRFIAGLDSDEAMFRYLMDNAIASKEALNLSVGISLSAEQVAALTHDIVWMEEREVMGEQVLVPVLYMAQAEGRLAPNGALIQGQDLALISGGDLSNQGTLRATNTLSAQAQNIQNSGLMQAGERLSLLAEDSLYNRQGGILAGRDVDLTARTGDILNERSITRHESALGNSRWETSFADSAARIEAANGLSLNAGSDVLNLGGVLNSGGDMQITAGRDVSLSSVEERHSISRGSHYLNSQTAQLISETVAGGNLMIDAGRDLTAVASRIESGQHMQLVAGNDLTLASAANESHHYSKSKKVTSSQDRITQQSSVLQAGANVVLQAGTDLNIIGSQVQAGQDIHLEAGQDMHILSAQDESASFYFKKSKGSLGRSKSKQQESYQSSNVASVIDAGRNLTVNATLGENGAVSLDGGRNVTLVGSQLKAGNDLVLGATGDIAILSGIEEQGSYSKKTKSGFLGLSKSGKSQLKTTATQVGSELEAGSDLVVLSGRDIGVRASELHAGQDVELHAGLLDEQGDINLLSASNQAYSLSEKYRKKTGVSVSGGMLSVSAAKKAGQAAQSSTSVGSQVTAQEDASLYAERDINLVGSSVSAGGSVLLDAGRDVQIAAAQNQQADSQWKRERRTGIALDSDRNGFTAFAGNDTRIDKLWDTQQTAAASQLEAGLDVNVRAGQDIRLTGSDLAAGRDINLGAERNILLDAASERRLQQQEEIRQRTGLTVNISHNAGNTLDALKDLGKGDNALSKVSSVLKAADSVTQFVSGPTTAEHIGTTRQKTQTTEQQLSQRESNLLAGRDINLQAGESIFSQGTLLQGQRDINLKAKDILLDVARGGQQHSVEQTLSQSGINGGTTFNSARAGIGGSHGTEREDGWQGSSLPTRLQAGRDVQLDADSDLTLVGSQIQAGRNIGLNAGQDLNIFAAANDSSHQTRRKSGGGEVGVALGGQDFISLYASVDIGRGRLDREGKGQQEAYLYAGNQLNFNSGRDTTIAGAQLEGEQVIGRVGRDLRVASIPDTGKVSGKELDASVTVSIGYGSGSVSGSVGVGKTTGSTDWVDSQTRIVARDELDIRTENHTQLDGAVLASKTGNLKLDTDTLGFRDLEGHDRERSWYINAGGTYSWGGDGADGSGQPQDGNAAAQQGVVDSSQNNKDGSNQWNVSGHYSEKEREQIVRATVGEGKIIVRNDAETGRDSTQGLNRDTDKAYEITKDKQETTELYVSSSSLDAVSNPTQTFEQWKQGVKEYGRNSVKNFLQLGKLQEEATTAGKDNALIAALAWAPTLLVEAMDALNTPTGGIFPGVANHGGLATQIPVLAVGDLLVYRAKGNLKLDENGQLVIKDGKPVLDGTPSFDDFHTFQDGNFTGDGDKVTVHISTNGIMNDLLEALINALMQGGMADGRDFVLAYNPTHGLIGDLLESAFDSLLKGSIKSGTARNLDELYQNAASSVDNLYLYGHSQGGLLTWVAIKGQDFSNVEMVTVQVSGAPIDAIDYHDTTREAGVPIKNSVYQVNRPDEQTVLGLPKTDSVADLPGLGGNAKYSDNPVALSLGAIFSLNSLFDTEKSSHSNYGCASCDPEKLNDRNLKVREMVINPTLIDKDGNVRRLIE